MYDINLYPHRFFLAAAVDDVVVVIICICSHFANNRRENMRVFSLAKQQITKKKTVEKNNCYNSKRINPWSVKAKVKINFRYERAHRTQLQFGYFSNSL